MMTSEGNKLFWDCLWKELMRLTINISNNTKVEVSHYFKIDGVIDLKGRQLVQNPK
jgi:hypothetical protein